MAWNFSNDKPIFQQIIDVITTDIISKKYAPGEKLPAVRDLAIAAGVNPNTMQRALTDIEATGLIYSKRGDGRYVSEDDAKRKELLTEYAGRETDSFIAKLTALGLTSAEMIDLLKNELENTN